METKKTSMELLKEFAPEFAQHQMNNKVLLFEDETEKQPPTHGVRMPWLSLNAKRLRRLNKSTYFKNKIKI